MQKTIIAEKEIFRMVTANIEKEFVKTEELIDFIQNSKSILIFRLSKNVLDGIIWFEMWDFILKLTSRKMGIPSWTG